MFTFYTKGKDVKKMVTTLTSEWSFFEKIMEREDIQKKDSLRLKKLLLVYNEIFNTYGYLACSTFLKLSQLQVTDFDTFKKTCTDLKKGQAPLFAAPVDPALSCVVTDCVSEIVCSMYDTKGYKAQGTPATLVLETNDLSRVSSYFMLLNPVYQVNLDQTFDEFLKAYNHHKVTLVNLLFLRQKLFQEASLKHFLKPSLAFCDLLVFDCFLFEYLSSFYLFVDQYGKALSQIKGGSK